MWVVGIQSIFLLKFIKLLNSLKMGINIFGVATSIEEFSHAFVIEKLSLFKRLSILPTTCEDHSTRWQINEEQFSNVAFVAKQIRGILKSQMLQFCKELRFNSPANGRRRWKLMIVSLSLSLSLSPNSQRQQHVAQE